MLERSLALPTFDAMDVVRFHRWHERAVFESMKTWITIPGWVQANAKSFFTDQERLPHPAGSVPSTAPPAQGDGRLVFRRNPEIKGTMGAFGYDYFTDKYGEEKAATIRLLRHSGLRGSGSEYAYEVLNLTDGKRSEQEIRDAVSAIYGPVSIDVVLEYLKALETINVVQRVER